ncbi:threonine synthase [Desulfomonile tiedjei]|uniref:Threonine synthase n=1 Tax=Desulfomonile tiedjei (strain ATCC 49306 / DSM 6799 / DCB-1) TaxID=706587 RepID=I4C4B4_DESTA|nr:threonine synthase [Desulfomonile tiedjei]AFM24405.1 L-threonine synthase [Desulfomonile tiedjei DSM 6799]
MWKGIIRQYPDFYRFASDSHVITLLEGNTPLIPVPRLAAKIKPGISLYLKYEGLNPSSSFKDRGMTLAVSRAVEAGSNSVICASTGNTSASAAAYAARAGIKAFVLIPEGKIALGKLAQAMIHGAIVIKILGNFDEALKLVREISDNYPVTLVNSVNPHRIEGQKSAAFEVCDALGVAPDYHCLPVGNAGNITAYWAGYKVYKDAGKINALPKMFGFQAEGAAPIVRGHIVENPETVATAIRIGNPASWKPAEAARDESGGLIDMVTDEEILEAYKMVASLEGVFCEPASAASIAGLIKKSREGYFETGSTIVCTLTGHGLKDPDNAIKVSTDPVTCEPDMKKVLNVLGF